MTPNGQPLDRFGSSSNSLPNFTPYRYCANIKPFGSAVLALSCIGRTDGYDGYINPDSG